MTFTLKPTVNTPTTTKKFDSDLVAIVDLDLILHSVAGVGETRSIVAVHKESGREKSFNSRTEFWGKSRKTLGGWLGETNQQRIEKRQTPFTKDDFEIRDIQTPEPIENVLHSAKMMPISYVEALGTNNVEYYIGSGASQRLNQSTLMKYKGNRDDTLRSLYLDDVRDYLIRTFKPTVVTGIETDDAVTIRAYGDPNAVIITRDKDAFSQPTKVFNPDKPDWGVVDCDCFGELWIDDSGSTSKVRGHGRLHLYFQCLGIDQADNYQFSKFSDKKFGEKAAYKALVDCKNDQEALTKMIEVAKELYPESKVIEGWRGNRFTIDWMYVLREHWLMAKMLWWENDYTTWDDWLVKHEIKYEY